MDQTRCYICRRTGDEVASYLRDQCGSSKPGAFEGNTGGFLEASVDVSRPSEIGGSRRQGGGRTVRIPLCPVCRKLIGSVVLDIVPESSLYPDRYYLRD
ncbi:MAG: hypothetical protein IKP20_07595 [Candidatus Methanomethylophilaceae archaeon]|nr:hypothetical protein [Candidatus Methanomethylophilaceae archaeon]